MAATSKQTVYIIDPNCKYNGSGSILVKNDVPYICTLNMTDIKTNKNKFYIMQIIKSGSTYVLFIRYGRVGEVGKISYDNYNNEGGAIAKFEKQFSSKTKNKWHNKDNFVRHKDKYYLCELESESHDIDAAIDTDSDVKIPDSTLDNRVKDFIKLISDVELMKKTLIELDIDTNKMPLGKIKQSQIDSAYAVLTKIKGIIATNSKTVIDDCMDLSSEFYTYIPYACSRAQVPPIIDGDELINKYVETLDEISNMVIAANVIENTDNTKALTNPIDSIYSELNTTITPLEKDGVMWNIIKDYVHNTHASTHDDYKIKLRDIYEIDRKGEREAYEKCAKGIGNKMLLWHGTRLTNFISIMKQGLLLRPDVIPGTYISGKMFGYGIYGASSFSKSFNYTGANKQNNIACLFLAEFALGNQDKRTSHDYYISKDSLKKTGHHSTWGLGESTPKSFTEIDGIQVPNGKLTKGKTKSSLLYDEFIVYDASQLTLRYIVEIEGDFKW